MVLGVLAFVVDRKSNGPALVSSMSVGFMGYITFIIAMQLPWAFRGDIVHMDCLKSLPVSPLSVAIGELTGGVTLLSAIQFVPLVAVLLAGGSPAVLVSAIAFVIPFNLLILAMCNTVFLIYPIRFPQGNSADFQMVGRMMLMMFLQILLLIPALGVPAAVAAWRMCSAAFIFRSSWWSPGSPLWRSCRCGCSCWRRCLTGLIRGRKCRLSRQLELSIVDWGRGRSWVGYGVLFSARLLPRCWALRSLVGLIA